MKLKKYILPIVVLLPILVWPKIIITEANGTFQGLGHARTHDFPVEAHIFTILVSEPDSTGTRNVDVEVSVNDLHSGNAIRDTHMRMSVLDRKNHPLITFHSTVELDTLREGMVYLPGKLEINGVSKSYGLKLNLKQDGEQWFATGSFRIMPTDFGLPLVGMGPMKVLDKVDLNLNVRF